MPYNSYIDVSNFSSPLHLVNYLKEIINDENRYKSYFEWKNNYLFPSVSYLKLYFKTLFLSLIDGKITFPFYQSYSQVVSIFPTLLLGYGGPPSNFSLNTSLCGKHIIK